MPRRLTANGLLLLAPRQAGGKVVVNSHYGANVWVRVDRRCGSPRLFRVRRRIGQRIHREVLGSERAAYGEQIVVTVSRQVVLDYGRGYSVKNLRRMNMSRSRTLCKGL